MDLWWRFNNVRIKKGDKWKGAFMTHVGSFKLTAMFFGMMNSPATFQAMMNEILRDMINEGKVAAFCYQGTVNVLSGHPRWMFRKNLMEFFIGLQPYLYYYYSGCTLESHGHMSFPECSMVT